MEGRIFMAGKYLMALDAGTGSVRAVLFDTSGHQLGCVQKEWSHKEDPRYPGSMDFDWTHNWALASGCVREVLKETKIPASEIAAVSTTCMREGIVLYDSDGREIWACANVDARSGDEVAELKQLDPELEKELYGISGQTYALGALPRLLWVKNKMPELYEKTATMSMFNDWLIYKLTGVMASEPSNGCTTGIFRLQSRDWDASIAARCGLKDNIFPKALECGTVVADVSGAGAEQTGLAKGTPVVTGGGDAQLGCIGVGLVKPNQAAVFGGSFWQYEFNSESAATDPGCRVRVNCHAVPGLWQHEAIAFMPGLAMRWYRDAFCQAEKEEAARLGLDPYQLMNREAEKVPAGCYGMMCSFSDVMNYISWRHAAPTFGNFDFDPQKFNRYTFYRAIMENAALVTRGHMDLVREAAGGMPEEIIFASGASKSPLWCQIVADVMGLPVKVPVVKEATALGAAILAGYGVGVYGSIEEAADSLVKWEKTYIPNSENHDTYNKMYTVWREFYLAQLSLSDRRVTRYMWAAPGL
jgi:autoinducer 2 (AI-2) kinase